MIPRQEPLPFVASGCVIEASELQVPVFVEGAGTRTQSWFRWSASCGAVQGGDQRSSHPDLAVERGVRTHVCGVTR